MNKNSDVFNYSGNILIERKNWNTESILFLNIEAAKISAQIKSSDEELNIPMYYHLDCYWTISVFGYAYVN